MKTLVAAAEPPDRPDRPAAGPWLDESYTWSSGQLAATVASFRLPVERVATVASSVEFRRDTQ